MAGACKCGHDYATHTPRTRRCTSARCKCSCFTYDEHGADQDSVIKWTHFVGERTVRWTYEKKVSPALGEKREVVKFAVLQRLTEGDIIVWLEKYIEVQEWRNDKYLHMGDGRSTTTTGWVAMSAKHICRPEGPSVRGGYSPFHPCICGQEALAGVRPDGPWPRA